MSQKKFSTVSDEDTALFRKTVGAVRALKSSPKAELAKTRVSKVLRRSDTGRIIRKNTESESVWNLSDAYDGKAFKAEESVDYQLKGSGLSPKMIRQIREGLYPLDSTLDLHGYTVEEARVKLSHALLDAYKKQQRCILAIHGKGRKLDGYPILKNHIYHWLKQIPIVLFFCSAHPKDGGTGAVYILLKRERVNYV